MESKNSKLTIKEKTLEWMRGYSTHRKHIMSIDDWFAYGVEVKASAYYRELMKKNK